MVHQTQFLFTLLPLLLFIIFKGGEGEQNSWEFHEKRAVRLFVFGDSYVDTGNFLNSGSYKPPNGITFPGKPAGRFGDGRILTDYIASFLGIRSPVPYRLRKHAEKSKLENGMNYACGGTGILNTLFSDGPNLTTQIDSLQKLIQQNVYTKHDLQSSAALVNVGGNDYATFFQTNGTLKVKSMLFDSCRDYLRLLVILQSCGLVITIIKEVTAFSSRLVNQLCSDLKHIEGLGVRKIAVALMMPIGCLPQQSVVASYKKCVEIPNLVSQNHNQMLLHSLANMNHQLGNSSVFITLDLYNTFLSAITSMQKRRAKDWRAMNPLEPCVSIKVDKKGTRKYIVCEKPEVSFFWDIVHPSQNGWHAVYKQLQSSLQLLVQEKS